jgi:ubiquinone/menaquinone biosynthesis C-methylase UbiE
MQLGSETQAQSAQRMYDSRAKAYDKSWHTPYASRFASYLAVVPGDTVLDLCCGTGLNAFAAAEQIGPSGRVIGVDISEAMLDLALQKQTANQDLGKRCLFLKGDVIQLDDVFDAAGLDKHQRRFDWITCCSAFVLLDDPSAALAHWKQFLKDGGRMTVDVPHEHNLRSGVILEKVAHRLGVRLPFNRSWVSSADSFANLAEAEGLEIESTAVIENVMGEKTLHYEVEEADAQFDKIVQGSLLTNLTVDEFKERARPLFREEWAKAAVDGKVEAADMLYLYVLRHTPNKGLQVDDTI